MTSTCSALPPCCAPTRCAASPCGAVAPSCPGCAAAALLRRSVTTKTSQHAALPGDLVRTAHTTHRTSPAGEGRHMHVHGRGAHREGRG